MDPERQQLLAEVASMYYDQGLNQSEIAEFVGVSRSMVSRLLAEARDEGIVQITIRWPWRGTPDLEQALVRQLGLKAARVLTAGHMGYSQLLQGLGSLAARLLENQLQDNMILGISWNTGVYQVVNALRAARSRGVTVVQLTGAVGSVNPVLDGPDLTRWLAETLGGRYRYLHAPLLVESAAVRQALVQDRSIRETLELGRQAQIALVGIGAMLPALCSLFIAGYINEAELRDMTARGAVGDVCTYHYNILGEIVPLELHERVIGIDVEGLRQIPMVIGVAGGREKAAAILGAIRSRLVNCLVTDDVAAQYVLRLAGRPYSTDMAGEETEIRG